MNIAWISARAGHAIVATESETFLLEAGRQAPPKPCAPGRLNNLRALASDVTQMEAGAFPFPEVKAVLEKSWREQSALDLTLMTLDGDLSADLRQEAARVAARLMEREEVREAVRRRLLGVPLPEVADLEGAPEEGVVAELVREAAENRELVAIADKAWDQVFWEHFSYHERERLKNICVGEGGFSALVCALGTGNESCFRSWWGSLEEELSRPPIPHLLRKWQATAMQLFAEMKVELLLKDIDCDEELKPWLRGEDLMSLPQEALTLSPKARGGVVSHVLATREARERHPKPVVELRRKLLEQIGVGSV